MNTYIERPKTTWYAGQWWPPGDPRHEPLHHVAMVPDTLTSDLEYMTFARQVWLRAQEIPGSGWTVIDGPMMSMCVLVPPGSFVLYAHPDSPPVRVYTADAFATIFATADLERDAQRWRSLMACERIRFIGGSFEASPREPDALVGFDFHRKHPEKDDEKSRSLLLDFVDGEILGGRRP